MSHATRSSWRWLLNATAFAQEPPETAKVQRRSVADQFRPSVLKLSALMDSAEEDVLAYINLHHGEGHNPMDAETSSA